MNQRYTVFRRENGIYYSLDTVTKKRNSLNTTDREEACKQPAINLQFAQVYLQHSDPDFAKRTWQHVMDEIGRNKSGSTKKRWDVAMKDKTFDLFRDLALIKTQAQHFFEALHRGTVSTNVFLRRVQNFALDMDWIPKAVIPKRQAACGAGVEPDAARQVGMEFVNEAAVEIFTLRPERLRLVHTTVRRAVQSATGPANVSKLLSA